MIRRILRNFEEITGSILLVVICLIAALQVLSRYLFAHPFSWTEELGTYLFIYLTFIGASLALKKNEHFALDSLLNQFPDNIRHRLRICIALLVILSSVIIVVYGCHLVHRGMRITTPALEIPRAVPYAAVPLGGLLMLFRSGEMLVCELRRRINKNTEEQS